MNATFLTLLLNSVIILISFRCWCFTCWWVEENTHG